MTGVSGDIIIISGLPRSGTSLMMQMLEAGGVELLTDSVREADGSNPRGYYEYEKVRMLKQDSSWIGEAEGKAVKVISTLVDHLPSKFSYRVIFMLRDVEEILISQRAMLAAGGIEASLNIDDATLREELKHHVASVRLFLDIRYNFSVLGVNYSDVIEHPSLCAVRVNGFLGGRLDEGKMAGAVDSALYRQRQSIQEERR